MSAEQHIPAAGGIRLGANLDVPDSARGVVVFAHGSGSSRTSPRNQYVAATLRRNGVLGTLLFDLLTPEEDAQYANRFEIDLLAARLSLALDWLAEQPNVGALPVGLFGASTGAAAAMATAAARPEVIKALVSRGGRPDLAAKDLPAVSAPVLLIVGGEDHVVIALNKRALGQLNSAHKKLEIVPGATHLFEEPGTLERVAQLTTDWFEHFLAETTSR